MAIPTNDTQLWKGFNGHGLYAKRAERDRNGEEIVTTYAKKTDVPALTDELNTSSTTAVTPNAVKEAIDDIVHIPDTANQPSTLCVGSQSALGWTGWESETMTINTLIPEHCVVLDYFTEGYRLGVKATGGTVPSVTSETISGINPGTRFPDGVPVAVFDSSSYSPTLDYVLSNLVNLSDGFSIEYWLKLGNSSGLYYACNEIKCERRCDFRLIYRMNNTYGHNYINTTGQSSFDASGGASSVGAWTHHAITRIGNNLQLYQNGTRRLNKTVYDYQVDFPEICFTVYQNAADVNHSLLKATTYRMAQLAVWDYPKYTANFTPSSTLIVDQTFE